MGEPNAYYSNFAKITGATAAIFLSQFLYWDGKQSDPDLWIYKKYKAIIDETGLSEREIDTARVRLKNLGIMEEKRKGVPPILYFRFDWQKLTTLLNDKRTNQKAQNVLIEKDGSYSLTSAKRTNQKAQTVPDITENTNREYTENNTQYNTQYIVEKNFSNFPDLFLPELTGLENETDLTLSSNQTLNAEKKRGAEKAPPTPPLSENLPNDGDPEKWAWTDQDQFPEVSKMVAGNNEIEFDYNGNEITQNKPEIKKKDATTDFDKRCSESFCKLFESWGCKGVKRDAKVILLMRTVDSWSESEIREVYQYLVDRGDAGEFQKVVRSLSSLRKKGSDLLKEKQKVIAAAQKLNEPTHRIFL